MATHGYFTHDFSVVSDLIPWDFLQQDNISLKDDVLFTNQLLSDTQDRRYDFIEKSIEMLVSKCPDLLEVWYLHPYLETASLLPRELVQDKTIVIRHAGSDLYYHLRHYPSVLKSLLSTIVDKYLSTYVITDDRSIHLWKAILPKKMSKVFLEPMQPMLHAECEPATRPFKWLLLGKLKPSTKHCILHFENSEKFCSLDIYSGQKDQISDFAPGWRRIRKFSPIHPKYIPSILASTDVTIIDNDNRNSALNHSSRVFWESANAGNYIFTKHLIDSLQPYYSCCKLFCQDGWHLYSPKDDLKSFIHRLQQDVTSNYCKFANIFAQ